MEEQHHDATYDIVIFGASGFTGKYVVREALKFLNVPTSPFNSLALVGRSPSKVAKALQWASHPNPPPQIPILTADTTDPISLRRVASQTKILLNCVGPFHLYGEPVVAACVDVGCDYLDITGEMEFVERMEASYYDKAAKKGSLIICGCGYDSVPAVLGMMFNSRQWVSPAAPNRVEGYLSMESDKRVVLNLGTYETMVLAMANKDKLQELRHCTPQRPQPMRLGFGAWCSPSSLDKIAVERMVSCLTENPEGIPGVNESAQQIKKEGGILVYCETRSLWYEYGIKISVGCTSFHNTSVIGKMVPTEEEVANASFKLLVCWAWYSDAALASKEGKKPGYGNYYESNRTRDWLFRNSHHSNLMCSSLVEPTS
nr:probable mitochondrial saccharopine dehydrogenase-like oxidoreductase At5g39410 [Ipomoea batatas]